MNRDILGWAALIAALVGTASAEYSLALACGFGPILAGCVPAALDIYALRAFRVHRDVAAVVAALILVNALAHLVASGLLPVSIPLVIGVSAIAPLVMWRVHALKTMTSADTPSDAPVAAPALVPDAPALEAAAPALAVESQPDADEAQPDADPRLVKLRALDASNGKPIALRRIQAEFKVGQRTAQQMRSALAV